MFKLLLATTMAAAQDSSKCREFDFETDGIKLDEDCCAIKGLAWCDSDYVQEWTDDICFKAGEITAHTYSCFDPSLYKKGGHDSSKCWDYERGFDPSCCSETHQGFCDGKWAIAWQWDKVCDATTPTESFSYECLPPIGLEEAATRNSAMIYLMVVVATLVYQ